MHTPGPWTYESSTKTVRSEPANYWLASMDSWDGAIDNEANARLIASAPELLAALEAVELWSREHPNGTCEAINEKARAAIAKAKP